MDTTITEEGVTGGTKEESSPSKANVEQFLEAESKSTEDTNGMVKLSIVSGDMHDTILVDKDKVIAIEPEQLEQMADSDDDKGEVKTYEQENDEVFIHEDEEIGACSRNVKAERIGSTKVVKGEKDLDPTPDGPIVKPTPPEETASIRTGGVQDRNAPDSVAHSESKSQVRDKSSKSEIPEIITTDTDTEPEKNKTNIVEGRLDGKTDKNLSNVKHNATGNAETKNENKLNGETDKIVYKPNVRDMKAMDIVNTESNKKEEVRDTSEHNDVPTPLDHTKTNHSSNDKGASENWMDILGSGHLLKKVLKPGIPNTRPNKSDICILNYKGWLEDGTIVEKADNLKIQLNDNEVIQGIDFALALMDKGEEAELKVSSRFAYGAMGKEPNIPSGSTLTYHIKLLDVQDEPIIHSLSLEERVAYGLQKKERGNFWYTREDHSLAIDCYRRALEYLDDTGASEPQDVVNMQKLLEERLKTYNNLAASQLRVCAFDAALMSVNNVLNAQPKNVKALYRKTKILREKGEIEKAMDTIRSALSYEPDLKILQQELSSLLAEDRKIFCRERELYKKMLGNNPNQEKEDEKKNSSNRFNTFKWITIISFAVAVIGTIAFKYSK